MPYLGSAFTASVDSEVSCTTTDECVLAVGWTPGCALASRRGGGWRTVTNGSLSLGGDALSDEFLACDYPSWCAVAGVTDNGRGRPALLMERSGGAFTSVGVQGTARRAIGPLSCTSATTCALGLGGGLEVTDGGATWRLRPTPSGARLLYLDCADAFRCQALATTGGVFGPYEMDVTTDGGRSWSRLGLRLPPGALLHGLSCPSFTSCAAIGETDTVTAGQYSYGQPFVATTTDGWRHLAVSRGPGQKTLIVGISCWSADDCMATGYPGMRNGSGEVGGPPVVYDTLDGWRTWRSSPVASIEAGAAVHSP